MGVCPAGSEGAKQQRPQVADAEEKKSQISADSGLSVTSGSQVIYTEFVPAVGSYGLFFLILLIFIRASRKVTQGQ